LIEGDNLVVLDGATLIDGTGAPPSNSSVVVLEGDRIIRIGRSGVFRFPEGTEVLNLAGHWVLPGFVEMHSHLPGPSLQTEVLRTYLAHGVTSLVNPAASDTRGVGVRDALAQGLLVGPTMFTAGRGINGPSFVDGSPMFVSVGSEDEARGEVRRQAKMGVDLIKVFGHLGPDLVAAVIDEAHAHGLKVTGHLGRTSWRDAVSAGIDILLHSALGGPTWELVPISERFRFRDNILPPSTGLADYDASLFRDWRGLVDLDGSAFQDLVTDMTRAGVTVDPNLVVYESIIWGDDPSLREILEPDVGPEAWASAWRSAGSNPTTATWDAEDHAEAKAAWPVFLEMVLRFHEAGIRLTAGSDLANPWITPGVAYHRELELLVSAGIPSMEVLSIATRNGAEALGLLDQFGTIEEGKMADLVVLGADPLEDIKNTRSVRLVIRRGVRFLPEDLMSN
jgi:imidazolonepropionase-like amidohydrolase